MNKLLLLTLAVCVGIAGFAGLRATAKQTEMASAKENAEWQAGTNLLANTQKTLAALRAEMSEKRSRAQGIARHPKISPALLAFLEGHPGKELPSDWTELRELLDIGWNSSADYIMVRKQALKKLDYNKVWNSGTLVTDTMRELLVLSPQEKSAINSILKSAASPGVRAERIEPSGDIVAQYTVPAPDPATDQSLSNYLVTQITGAIGPERTDLIFPGAWYELSSAWRPSTAETMTIRQTVVDGQPDLICEMKRGDNVSTSPVRYANYPCSWLTALFPGGWQTLADREGFTLPPPCKAVNK